MELYQIIQTSRLNGRWVMPFKKSIKLVEKVKENAFQNALRTHSQNFGGMSVVQGEGIAALADALEKDKELTHQVNYEEIAQNCNGTIVYQDLCVLDNGLRFLRFTDKEGRLIPIARLSKDVKDASGQLTLYYLDNELGDGLSVNHILDCDNGLVNQSIGLCTDVGKRRICFTSDFFIGKGQNLASLSTRYFTNTDVEKGYSKTAELRVNTDPRYPALELRLEDYKDFPGCGHQLYLTCDNKGNPRKIEGLIREEIDKKPTWESGVTNYERKMLSTHYPNKGKPYPCDPAREFKYSFDSEQGRKLAQLVIGENTDISNLRVDIKGTIDNMARAVIDKTYPCFTELIKAA